MRKKEIKKKKNRLGFGIKCALFHLAVRTKFINQIRKLWLTMGFYRSEAS